MKWYVIAYVDYKRGESVIPTWDSGSKIAEIYKTPDRATRAIENGNFFKREEIGDKPLEVVEIEISIPEPQINELEVTMDYLCEKFGCKVIIKKDEADCPSCAD